MMAGRPMKFESVEDLESQIDAFFETCKDEKMLPTITGLAVYLDTTRRTLLDYETEYGDEFSHAIKRAKARVEAGVEQMLFIGKNAAGPIFNLKNNFGWKDQSQVDQNVSGQVEITRIERRIIDPRDPDS